MRRVLNKAPAWGTSVDIATRQLSRATSPATPTTFPSSGALQVLRRHTSSFQRPPQSNTKPTTTQLLQNSHRLSSPWKPAVPQFRPFNGTSQLREAPKITDRQDRIEKEKTRQEEEEEDRMDDEGGFQRSEKASKASQVNLSARLQSTKAQKKTRRVCQKSGGC